MSLPAAFFDRMYAGGRDPWEFDTRFYERRKREIVLASLPHERYRRAFEPGCATGALTALLAPRCDQLLALEVNAWARARARERLAGSPGVTVQAGALPGHWPAGPLDLVVLSEVLYYLDPAALELTLGALAGALAPGGTVLAVHWRHPVADYPQSGDAVHAALAARPEWTAVAHHLEEDFRLEVFLAGAAAPSVAARTGLLDR